MTNEAKSAPSLGIPDPSPVTGLVTALVPARNEESVIAACIESLAGQPEIGQILVIDDQSSDRTARIVLELMQKIPHLRLLETAELPDGWVGKNHALWTGVQQAKGEWFLFTDADAIHSFDSAPRALQIASEQNAALVSFSPEQITEAWYEKALIPFIYLRLAKRFSYDQVNDPRSSAAAANGQFLMIRSDVYREVGGHQGIAGEILEDVALAVRVKSSGKRIWFGSGKNAVRVRMYRSFDAMWEGWKKNLYRLVGGTGWFAVREIEATVPWISLLLILAGLKLPLLLFIGVLLLIARQTAFGLDLARNHFPFSFIFYYVPATALYAAVLWASYRSHVNGSIRWKGRRYAIGDPESAK
jgi:glycosyltransferase involved in cell wall biosynthesis